MKERGRRKIFFIAYRICPSRENQWPNVHVLLAIRIFEPAIQNDTSLRQIIWRVILRLITIDDIYDNVIPCILHKRRNISSEWLNHVLKFWYDFRIIMFYDRYTFVRIVLTVFLEIFYQLVSVKTWFQFDETKISPYTYIYMCVYVYMYV